MKPSCSFLKNARAGARVFLAALLIATGTASAEEPAAASSPAPGGTPAALSSSGLPVLTIHEAAAPSPDHQIRIGDRVTLQLELGTLDPGQAKTVLKAEDASKKPEDSGWFIDPSTLNQGGVLRFVASPLKGGELPLPSLVLYAPEDRAIARTAPLTLKVAAPAQSDSGKPDLLDVLPVDLPLRYRILLVFLLAGLAVAGYFGYRAWKRRQRAEKPAKLPLVQKEPDHLAALRKLDILFDAHPFTPANLKIVSFGVSEILKEFFSRRFRIDALESTTDEMMALLKRESLSHEHLREIRNLFDELDLYKFTDIGSYPRVYPEIHEGLKLKAQIIIQKWTLVIAQPGPESKVQP